MMSDILMELYQLLDDGGRTPGSDRARQAAKPWIVRLEERFPELEEFDGMWCALLEIGAADHPVWFARGFRLGAQMMLAALGEKNAPAP